MKENIELLSKEEAESKKTPINKKRRRKHKKQQKLWVRILKWTGITLGSIIGAVVIFFLTIFYTPFFPVQRDQYIMMTYGTSNPWLCTLFFTDAQIEAALARNGIKPPEGNTNPNLVDPNGGGEEENVPKEFVYSEKYKGEVIFEENGVQIQMFSGKTESGKYTARIIQIFDPSRVVLATTNDLAPPSTDGVDRGWGQPIGEMLIANDALCGINAGGWLDPGGVGTSGTPKDILIKNGEILRYDTKPSHKIIGFNQDNVLVLGDFTDEQIIENKIRDGMSWEPYNFLIVNGVPAETSGISGGYDPRSAIGQRADGTVLLLVVDGSTLRGIDGANMELIIDIMMEYGAVNAANLDGGTSSSMGLQGKIINTVCNPQIVHRGRRLNSCWVVKNAVETPAE